MGKDILDYIVMPSLYNNYCWILWMHFSWVICSWPPLFLGKWHALPFIISLLLLTRLFPQRACGMWQSI